MRALPKVTMMKVVGVLIKKDMLESAAKVINRSKIMQCPSFDAGASRKRLFVRRWDDDDWTRYEMRRC